MIRSFAVGQDRSCIVQGMPKTRLVAYLKSLEFASSLEIPASYFQNGIELVLDDKNARIVGYNILRHCSSSDYMNYQVCGPRMDSLTLQKFKGGMDSRFGSLLYSFESITVEVSGKLYEATGFAIVPKFN